MPFNKVMLMGNLTRDINLSYTPQGVAVAKFGLAVNHKYKTSTGEVKEDPLFIEIVVWKKQAENCSQYLHKGSPVFIEGMLKLEKWEKDGRKYSQIKVVAQRVQFLEHKPKEEEGTVPGPKEDEIPNEQEEDGLPF